VISVFDLRAPEAYNWRVPAILKEPKSQRIVARVTVADKRLFRKAAAIEGRSLAQFVTQHAVEAAQSRRFVEALLVPPRLPIAVVRESIRACRRSVKSGLLAFPTIYEME
jgi:hypothetical protein